MSDRQCITCRGLFPLDGFHVGSTACKACKCAATRAYRLANLEACRESDRIRRARPERRQMLDISNRKWRQANRDRMSAHNKANRASLEAPVACEGCGRNGARLEKHHPDYSKQLLIVWLCKPCHAIADKIRRIQEASQ